MKLKINRFIIAAAALLCIGIWTVTKGKAKVRRTAMFFVSSNQTEPRYKGKDMEELDATAKPTIDNKRFAKCPFFKEMTDIDFSQPDIKNKLCKNTALYEQQNGMYPVCEITDSVPDVLSSSAAKGSVKTFINGYNKEKIPIYVLPAQNYISNTNVSSHNWEGGLTNLLVRFALSLKDATLLDVGCNLGVFTLAAAKAELPTVSLDANLRNVIRVRMSLQESNIDSSKSKILWGMVSADASRLQQLSFPSDCNSGGADKSDMYGASGIQDPIRVMPLAAERLKDCISTQKVVMKMGVEFGEADFLQTAGSLFDDLDIAVLMQEWLLNHKWVQFLSSKNYLPHSVVKQGFVVISDMETVAKGASVLWIKKDYVELLVNAA